jgi:hypothetical protein
MTVTIDIVRNYLNGLSDQRVTDEAIQTKINVATKFVNDNASVLLSAEDRDTTVMAYAGYLAFNDYCLDYERANGQVTPAMSAQLDILTKTANALLGSCRQGAPQFVAPVASTTSMEDSIQGSLFQSVGSV